MRWYPSLPQNILFFADLHELEQVKKMCVKFHTFFPIETFPNETYIENASNKYEEQILSQLIVIEYEQFENKIAKFEFKLPVYL